MRTAIRRLKATPKRLALVIAGAATPKRIAFALVIAGAAAVVAGIAQVYVPAAWIVGGLSCVAIALLMIDVE